MAKVQKKNTVIHAIAASNSWLIGLLLLLAGVVIVALYNYSTMQSVKGISDKVSTASAENNEINRISNGCFVLKGNFAVYDPCGVGLYKHVLYQCGDGTKIRLGEPTTCKSIPNWLSTVAFSCKSHTSCDTKTTPTSKTTGKSEISDRPTPTSTIRLTPNTTTNTINP